MYGQQNIVMSSENSQTFTYQESDCFLFHSEVCQEELKRRRFRLKMDVHANYTNYMLIHGKPLKRSKAYLPIFVS